MKLIVYYKSVQGYESGGTIAVNYIFFQKTVYKIAYYMGLGFHQHRGKSNGFPRSALLCQEADF